MTSFGPLDRLGSELERAIARDERRSPLRRATRAHAAGVVLAATLVLAGGAGSAGVLISQGEPVEVAPQDGPAPRAGTASLEPLRAADPTSRIPWGIRVATAIGGGSCHAVGRVLDGRLGVLRGTTFRELPASHADSCVRLGPADVAPEWSQYPGPNVSVHGARTVVHGLAGPAVQEVVVHGPGGERRLTPSGRGGFLTVYRGLLDAAHLEVEAVP